MKTKIVKVVLFLNVFSLLLFQCEQKKESGMIMTVNGPINSDELGKALIHEHLLVDFIGADSIPYARWDKDEVIKIALPYLKDVKNAGCQTFFDCTPAYLGRDVELLKRLSGASGINIVTNTGYYGARGNKFLPAHAFTESADELAQRWIAEWENGIENTGIKPGFIKIGVDEGPLSDIHKKLVIAAARTHIKTGLSIASHTGLYPAAKEQLDILDKEGVASETFIWVHAQAEKDITKHVELAKKGAWVSLDGIDGGNAEDYIEMIQNLKRHNLLSKVLISQDAGWYSPGEEKGGDFKSFNYLFDGFIPKLKESGFSEGELELLLVKNPDKAFSIRMDRLGN